jgi:hypothetical protein
VVSKGAHSLKVKVDGLGLDLYVGSKFDVIVMLSGMDLIGEYRGIHDVKFNGEQVSEEAAFKLLKPLSKPKNSKPKDLRRFLFKRHLLIARILRLRAGQRLVRRLPNNRCVTLHFAAKKRELIIENVVGTRVIFSGLTQETFGICNTLAIAQDLAGAFNLKICKINKQLTKLLNDNKFQCSFRMASGELVRMSPCETTNKRIADAFVLGVTPDVVPLLTE